MTGTGGGRAIRGPAANGAREHGFVHSPHVAVHCVGPRGRVLVLFAGAGASSADVIVVDVATMHVAVVRVLKSLDGRRRLRRAGGSTVTGATAVVGAAAAVVGTAAVGEGGAALVGRAAVAAATTAIKGVFHHPTHHHAGRVCGGPGQGVGETGSCRGGVDCQSCCRACVVAPASR